MATALNDPASNIPLEQEKIKIPAQILIECQEQKTRLVRPPFGREWGWRCTADEPLLNFKSDHTTWSAVGHEAEQAAIGKVKRDARTHLGKIQHDIEFECTQLRRASRYKKIEDAIKKIVYPIIYKKPDVNDDKNG